MKRSRWPHTVIVHPVGPLRVRLTCNGCLWTSEALTEPTISRLTLLAQEHRDASKPLSTPQSDPTTQRHQKTGESA